MSRNVIVAIVGSGKTTRSNVESLLGDFKDAVDSMTVVLPTVGATEATAWIKQYSEEVDISVIEDETVYEAIKELNVLSDKSVDLKFFLLWDDDDTSCQEAMHFAQQHSIPVFDLTDGLVRIPTDEGVIDAPSVTSMPESETNVEEEPIPANTFMSGPKESIFDVPPTAVLDDDDFDMEDIFDSEGGELIVEALQEAGRIFARAFVKEMVHLLKAEKDDEAE